MIQFLRWGNPPQQVRYGTTFHTFCIQSIAENLILKQLREASRSNTQHPLSSNLQSYRVCWILYMPIQASLRLNSHARSRNTRGNCTRTAKSLAFCWWATSPREVGISPACPSPILWKIYDGVRRCRNVSPYFIIFIICSLSTSYTPFWTTIVKRAWVRNWIRKFGSSICTWRHWGGRPVFSVDSCLRWCHGYKILGRYPLYCSIMP